MAKLLKLYFIILCGTKNKQYIELPNRKFLETCGKRKFWKKPPYPIILWVYIERPLLQSLTRKRLQLRCKYVYIDMGHNIIIAWIL